MIIKDKPQLVVGQRYPFTVPDHDTTTAHLYSGSNIITIFLSRPTDNEISSLDAGQRLQIGIKTLRQRDGFGLVCYLLADCRLRPNTRMTFETQINNKASLELGLPVDIPIAPERLAVDLVMVDRSSRQIVKIRRVSLPETLSRLMSQYSLEQLSSSNTVAGIAQANAELIGQHPAINEAIMDVVLHQC